MLTNVLTKDNVGERTRYAAILSGKLIMTVREYTPEAMINAGETDPYLMSIGYLGCKKQGIVFLLTVGGFSVVKHYEFSTRERGYRLVRQGEKVEHADHLFKQFEYDVYHSPYLRDLDYDCRSSGEYISHEFLVLPSEPRESDIVRLTNERDRLSYNEKLAQQEGRRCDPIEKVLALLHKWDAYMQNKILCRRDEQLTSLKARKKHNDEKLFSLLEDPITDEDRYEEAEQELKKIKVQLASGSLDGPTRIRIQAKLPKIREALAKKEDIEFAIEDAIDAVQPQLIDLGFEEFDGIGHG